MKTRSIEEAFSFDPQDAEEQNMKKTTNASLTEAMNVKLPPIEEMLDEAYRHLHSARDLFDSASDMAEQEEDWDRMEHIAHLERRLEELLNDLPTR